MSRKASLVWKFFVLDNDKDTVTCNTCKHLVKRDGGNTSNLRRHLQINHRDKYAELLKLETDKAAEDEEVARTRKRKLKEQPSVKDCFSKTVPYEKDDSKVRKLNNLLVQTICKDALPFRLVESDSFKQFVATLDPRYQLPTRKKLSSDMIPAMYDIIKQSVLTSISQSTAIALTTDAWTSLNNEAFIGVTAHYLLENFEYENRCLTVKHAPESHTAESISQHLEEVCEQWGIKQRSGMLPLYIVTDNGANVKKRSV